DRVVTSGDGQTIQLDFNYRPEGPEGQVNAPITMDDLAEVNQAGKIDVSQALQDGTLGATVAQIRGATVWVDGNVTVDARTLDRANIISGGAGLGFGAAFGASVAVVEMANKVDAAVLSDSDVEARQGRIRIGAGAYGLLGRQDADDIL